MAAFPLFPLFLLTLSIVSAQQINRNISIGRTLLPTDTTPWLSPSGLFAFGFYPEGTGFRVGIWLRNSPDKRTIVWTAQRDNPPVPENTELVLGVNGLQLAIAAAENSPISESSGACSSASMLDSGNFVLYDSSYNSIWESLDHPTDTILGGQSLQNGRELHSSASETDHSSGAFRLAMQSDNNLVLYPTNSTNTADNAYWDSHTYLRQGPLALKLYGNGTLSLVNYSSSDILILWPSSTLPGRSEGEAIYRGTLDTDGMFRLYSHSFQRNGSSSMRVLWQQPGNECQVKGFCGFNSYCTFENNHPNCLCFIGYNLVNPDQRSKGCDRSFSGYGCTATKENITFSIYKQENTVLDDDSYSALQLEEEQCKENCLQDCNCEAALFLDNQCKKLRLPLRYGRRYKSARTATFIKVGNSTSISDKEFGDANTPANLTRTAENGGKNKLHLETVIMGTVLATCCIAGFSLSAFLFCKNRSKRYKMMSNDGNFSLSEEIILRSFSYNELVEATDNFKEELGRGSFGTVYKGTLHNTMVAVKRLEKMVEEGEREFRAETRAIGRTHHRNLVRLLGFCDEGSARLLVYEYMSNGSLASVLFKAHTRLDWNERARIALEIARGIFYLHEDCQPHIIHCDIKPQNILLDGLWTAKISDFGLAKLLMPDQTRTLTVVRGTRGYLAPEWHKNTPISVKTDVYSFGILLLEIICCRRNIDVDVADDNEIILSEWVYRCFHARELQRLLHDEEVEMRILERLVIVGLWCIQDEPAFRPSMKNVILMMEGYIEVPIPPCPTSQ